MMTQFFAVCPVPHELLGNTHNYTAEWVFALGLMFWAGFLTRSKFSQR